MQFDLSISSLLQHGGVTLVLLVLASLYSWTIVIERWLAFRRAEAASERLVPRVTKLVRAGQVGEARELAQAETGSVAALLLAGLSHGSRDKVVLGEALQRKQVELMLGLEERLAQLGTVGSVAPYVGLFGTVLGIIRAFHSLSQGAADAAGASVVSAGIAEALVATAAGLAVAVPSVIFFNSFSRRLTVMETRLELAGSELVEAFTDKTRRSDADA
jgi:biopolymer transport protein ExbB/TolQ